MAEGGPALDAAVAEQVFGQKWWLSDFVVINGQRYDTPTWLRDGELPHAVLPGTGPPGATPPWYSRDVEMAWRVVEHLRQQGWLVILKEVPRPHRQSVCSLQWFSTRGAENTRRSIGLHPFAVGDSTPEAVCRCALDAVEFLERWEKRHG